MVLLDTNVIIDYLLGKEKIVELINGYSEDELSMSFVNEYELLKYKNRKTLNEAVKNLKVYHSNGQSVEVSAKAYQSLKSDGKVISDNDLLIFGISVANNELLITQDNAFRYLKSKSVKVIE